MRRVTTIDALVRAIQRDLSPQFEERLRAELQQYDREGFTAQGTATDG